MNDDSDQKLGRIDKRAALQSDARSIYFQRKKMFHQRIRQAPSKNSHSHSLYDSQPLFVIPIWLSSSGLTFLSVKGSDFPANLVIRILSRSFSLKASASSSTEKEMLKEAEQ